MNALHLIENVQFSSYLRTMHLTQSLQRAEKFAFYSCQITTIAQKAGTFTCVGTLYLPFQNKIFVVEMLFVKPMFLCLVTLLRDFNQTKPLLEMS